MNYSVCVIVVTFNRKELLLRNLRSTLSQSFPCDILIFDNHSSDGTYEFLKEHGILDHKCVHYHYSDRNTGGAGGFCKGMQLAYSKGYDALWLMDDDGYCYTNQTLELLISNIPKSNQPYILNPAVIYNDKKDLTFGFLDIHTYAELQNASKNGVYAGYINPFNGTLISRQCIEQIGFPKGEFFIYGDEHEYMLRALKNGIIVQTIADSLYYHPINRAIDYKKSWRFLVPIKEEPVWKTFCDTRNNIYIVRHYDTTKALLMKIYIFIAAAFIKKKNRWNYIKYTLLAISDGLLGKFDRPIMFDK